MSRTTKIQWCDSTVNPVMGCAGCELYPDEGGGPCYAGCDHERKGQASPGFAPTFLLPTLFPGRMAKASGYALPSAGERAKKPWLDGMPRLIFVSDMGDALSDAPFTKKDAPGHHVLASDVIVIKRKKGKDGGLYPSVREPKPGTIRSGGVPFEYLKQEVIDIAMSEKGRRHQWLWLTKRPQRMADFSSWLRSTSNTSWPANVWAGTSVTSANTLWRANEILRVGDERTLRFISAEPLWGPVSLAPIFASKPGGRFWVIAGGESSQSTDRRHHPVDLRWLQALRTECAAAGVPFFVKQLGHKPHFDGQLHTLTVDKNHGGSWEEWPVDLRLREMPLPLSTGW